MKCYLCIFLKFTKQLTCIAVITHRTQKGSREGGYSLASGLRDCLAQCTYSEQLGGRSMQQRRTVRFMIHQKEEGEKGRKKKKK